MPDTPLILAFDTSAAHCAAALLSGDQIIASVEEPMSKGQGERLLGLCNDVLGACNVAYGDLSAIGVGIGPGNFTGIRISVSAARGLALGLAIPAIGVSRLDAMAYGSDGVIVTSLDARQDQVFVQVFDEHCGSTPLMCAMDDLPKLPLHSDPVCIGHNADFCAAFYTGTVQEPALPVAEATAFIAASRLGLTNPRPAPLYLRPADAAPARDLPPPILP